MKLQWAGMKTTITAVHDGADLLILVTPDPEDSGPAKPHCLVLEAGILWNQSEGKITSKKITEINFTTFIILIYRNKYNIF